MWAVSESSANLGKAKEASIANIAMTTTNSIKVKPCWCLFIFLPLNLTATNGLAAYLIALASIRYILNLTLLTLAHAL